MYPPETLERVQLVRRALAVGFTLDELAAILGERDKGGSPCRKVHKLTTEKLGKVEEQLKALEGLRNDLKKTLTDWNTRLRGSDEETQHRLLDTLPVPKANGLFKLSPNSKRKKEGFK